MNSLSTEMKLCVSVFQSCMNYVHSMSQFPECYGFDSLKYSQIHVSWPWIQPDYLSIWDLVNDFPVRCGKLDCETQWLFGETRMTHIASLKVFGPSETRHSIYNAKHCRWCMNHQVSCGLFHLYQMKRRVSQFNQFCRYLLESSGFPRDLVKNDTSVYFLKF